MNYYSILPKYSSEHRIKSLITQVDIELTERCNNRCIHCLINQPEDDQTSISMEMSTEFVKNILIQIANLGCLIVRFTGGEPLLRTDFVELYLFARKLGMFVIIFTNGRLISKKLAVLFSKIPPGRPIEISVYGMHTNSYESVTKSKNGFSQMMQGMRYLLEHKVPFIVKQSILPPNRNEDSEFEIFAASIPFMSHKPEYSMNFDLRARRDNPNKNEFIKTLRLSPAETIYQLSKYPDYVNSMKEFVGKFMGPRGNNIFSCGAGKNICVDSYGNVQMCMLLRHPNTVFPLGEVSKGNPEVKVPNDKIKYILSELFPKIHDTVASNPEYQRRCAVCFLKGLCEQCPAKSWMEYGTLDTPVEYLCEIAHAKARYLKLLGESEMAWEVEQSDWERRVKDFSNPE